MTDEEFVNDFLCSRIPHEEWTHRAHVRAAFLIIRGSRNRPEAVRTMSDAIKRLNETHAKGGQFLEDVTRAWIDRIWECAEELPRETSSEEFIAAFPDLLDKRSVRVFS